MPRKRPEKNHNGGPPIEDAPDSFRVSQSKVKTYRRCRRAYHYKYVEKLRAKKKARALAFGSLVHQMIEKHAEGEDPFDVLDAVDTQDKKLFAAERAELEVLVNDARLIMTEYFEHWETDARPLRPIRIKGKSAEHSFDIEVMPGVVWNGKIDMIARREGLRWLTEHKTFKRKASDDQRWRNLQSVTYFRAMEMMGWPSVDGTCWDYVWSKVPMVPGLLASGKMSEKLIDTLPGAVIQGVRTHKLKIQEYRGFIEKSKVNRDKWFTRIYTRVDDEVKDRVFEDFLVTIREMVDNHGKHAPMNIEMHCSWCEFEGLCRAQLQGLDYDFIKERNYEKSINHNPQEADHIVEYEED